MSVLISSAGCRLASVRKCSLPPRRSLRLDTYQVRMTPPCVHNKQKAYCSLCSPHLFCQHGKRAWFCKPCGGGERLHCKHGIRQYICVRCGGKGICQHGKAKPNCIHCSGQNFCKHERKKWDCKECKGRRYCAHERVRTTCRECSSHNFCTHGLNGRMKRTCRQCNPVNFCEHGRLVWKCKICKERRHELQQLSMLWAAAQTEVGEELHEDPKII